MQFEGETVRVVKKGHPPLGAGVPADGLTGNAFFLQLLYGQFHVLHLKGQVAQSLGLWPAEPGRRAGNGENLQLAVPELQVQLPVATVLPLGFTEDGEAQFFHVEGPGSLVIRDDNGRMMQFFEEHSSSSLPEQRPA